MRGQLEAKKDALLSEGNQIRDFLDVKVAAKRISNIALSNRNGAFNICSGKGITIKESYDFSTPIPGLRLFSKTRALALAGWLGGLEPVKLAIEGNQLLLEAGQDDRWLVTDISNET